MRRQVFQPQRLFARERVVLGHDQHRVEGIHRCVAQIAGHVEHRTDGEIDRVAAKQGQPVLAGDVVQYELHFGMRLAIGLHQRRQQVEDGRTAGGHMQLAALQAFHPATEFAIQAIQPLDQRPGQLVQDGAFARQRQATADALEQGHAHVPLQGLQLQRHRGLAQEQGLGGPRHRAEPRGLAEGLQGLEPIALVVEAGGLIGHGSGGRSALAKSRSPLVRSGRVSQPWRLTRGSRGMGDRAPLVRSAACYRGSSGSP